MKEFRRDEIENWIKIFQQRGYEGRRAHLDSRALDYFVLPRAIFSGIPNGIFRMTGKPQDGFLIGVSDEVPEIIRPHFAFSEHDEFIVYGLSDLDRTFHSEQDMMRIIGEGDSDIKKIYVEKKVALYSYMLENSRDNLDHWGFTPQDYSGFQRALNFLKSFQ